MIMSELPRPWLDIQVEDEVSYPTRPIKERLRDLRGILVGEDEFIYRFAEYLADQIISDGILDLGFTSAYHLTIQSLRSGQNRWTLQSTPPDITGLPKENYDELSRLCVEIAKCVCPEGLVTKIEAQKGPIGYMVFEDNPFKSPK
jgi:hypothetical protein